MIVYGASLVGLGVVVGAQALKNRRYRVEGDGHLESSLFSTREEGNGRVGLLWQ
jgi:hypothetical protein